MSNPNENAAGRTPDGDTAPRLRAEPEDRNPSAWREPPWFPPDRERGHERGRARERGPNLVSIIVGLAFVLVGVYYFLDRTLGIRMPPIVWGSLWPVLLIALGALILLRSMERRR